MKRARRRAVAATSIERYHKPAIAAARTRRRNGVILERWRVRAVGAVLALLAVRAHPGLALVVLGATVLFDVALGRVERSLGD